MKWPLCLPQEDSLGEMAKTRIVSRFSLRFV